MIILRIVKGDDYHWEKEKNPEVNEHYEPFNSFAQFKMVTGLKLGDLVHLRSTSGTKYNGIVLGWHTETDNRLISIDIGSRTIYAEDAPERWEIYLKGGWRPFGICVSDEKAA